MKEIAVSFGRADAGATACEGSARVGAPLVVIVAEPEKRLVVIVAGPYEDTARVRVCAVVVVFVTELNAESGRNSLVELL